MTSNENNNPAIQVLLSDLVENILRFSDNPGACAEYVTSQIRELIGVRMVALIECISDETGTSHKLVGICPKKKESYWNKPEFMEFVSMSYQFETPRLIDPESDHDAEALTALGVGKSFVVPLRAGSEKVGMIVLLDLMDTKGVKEILNTLARIAGVIALILRNSFLYRNMESLVETRTQELRLLNEELEHRVAERTAQLQETNKELEAFSYSVSHDLRAPLRSIDGFSKVLLEDYPEKLDERGKDYLRRVRAASERMAGLIDDMLKLSRITQGTMKRKAVDLSTLARSVAEELRREEPDRRVEFIIQDGLAAQGDLPLLRVVLENLFGNSWKFTSRHETAQIEFGCAASDGKTEYFVRDDGAGFDMAYADKLFVPFQRLHADTEFPGTGIGLSIVQRIIHRHGGEVRAEGTQGQGATFYFTLQ